MARTEGNIFVDGFRGKVGGNMVFRKRKSGKVIVAKNGKTTDLPPTADQQKVRDKFKESSVYAKAAMDDAELKSMYAKAATGDQTVYNVALRDAAKAPEVKSVNTSAYSGQAGSTILVRAIDDFKVTLVKVTIRSAAGALIEEGDASVGKNGLDWIYMATAENAQVAGSIVKAVAFDIPGNEGILEVTL